jgi:site-specific recombinase XerD
MEVYCKTIQDILGHADISTTMNIYADVTKEHKRKTFENIESIYISVPK